MAINTSTAGEISSASLNFIGCALKHGPGTGEELTDRYATLVEVTNPWNDDVREVGAGFQDLSIGKNYRRALLVERSLHVVGPLVYASGIAIYEQIDLLESAGRRLEEAMPHCAIDGPRQVRRRVNHELVKSMSLFGDCESAPKDHLVELIEGMKVRPLVQTIARLAHLGRQNLCIGDIWTD